MAFKNFLGAIVIVIVILGGTIFNLFGDYLWFLSIEKDFVFLTILSTAIAVGAAAGLGFLIFSFLNIISARKKKQPLKPLMLIAALFAAAIAFFFSRSWEIVLKYLNSSSFGITDPVFSNDIGFYVFEFPFMSLLFSYGIGVILLTTIVTFITYALQHQPKRETEELVAEIAIPQVDWSWMKKKATAHLSFLLGLLFLVISFGFVLGQWGLLLSPTGTIFGAGYTEVNVTMPLFSIMTFISAAIGILFLANIFLKRWRLPLEGIAAFFIVLIIGLAVTGITQALVVSPDESNLEKPFIERNIKATLQAYDLAGVEETLFPVTYNLTQDDISKNEGTIRNIRLWDFRPLIQTYNQLQLFRTYYKFNDVDIDRYSIDGKQRQVMVSAREIDTSSLPSQAQTWVNNHLVYTHGYGIVMNPVDKVTEEGLPEFLIQNIPPKSSFADVERNEIYFGEGDLDYAVVGTTTEELDYPIGNDNVYTSYQGKAGVPLSGLNRLVYAVNFRSPEILFSSSIGTDSKLLMKRNILDRVQTITPFLTYDSDPYIVLSEGRLFWILDAYTTSNTYPYSQPFAISFLNDINYVRNPVKAVVDAYSGEANFYVIDPEDPVIQTYQKMFPSLFQEFEKMPSGLKEHIRYPEGLFRIQADIYSVYHMKDPRVFYNKEDIWVRPEEVYRGSRQEIIPYYVIMRLPGEEKEEFTLILPFVPRGKDNLIGWMAARSDEPNYGKITVFRFSKQELIYGPLQIEARIDQDTDISASFTLWGQSGSSVIRGNTLVIPIEDSILYIEPVFLEATEKGTLPQLKRVIVAYGNKLTMQPTLEEALETIFGAALPGAGQQIILPKDTPAEVLEQIAELFDQAQSFLEQGSLTRYAGVMEQIRDILSSY